MDIYVWAHEKSEVKLLQSTTHMELENGKLNVKSVTFIKLFWVAHL